MAATIYFKINKLYFNYEHCTKGHFLNMNLQTVSFYLSVVLPHGGITWDFPLTINVIINIINTNI